MSKFCVKTLIFTPLAFGGEKSAQEIIYLTLGNRFFITACTVWFKQTLYKRQQQECEQRTIIIHYIVSFWFTWRWVFLLIRCFLRPEKKTIPPYHCILAVAVIFLVSLCHSCILFTTCLKCAKLHSHRAIHFFCRIQNEWWWWYY